MQVLNIFLKEQGTVQKRLMGRLWVENEKLMMKITDPAYKTEIEKLIDWFSTQKLCSQVVGADFEKLDFITVDGYCLPDDAEYLLALKEAINNYDKGQSLYAELGERTDE